MRSSFALLALGALVITGCQRAPAASGESAQAPAPLSRYQVFLMGLRDTPTKEFFRVLRTDAGGNYAFTKVPAGSYKLTDTIGPDPKWRMKVTVEQAQDLSIDLTPDNSVKRRDDFPERK